PALAEKITVTVFKVTCETKTDDLSPAPDAWSRPDIPLHALAMLKNAREGIEPDQPGVVGPIKQIEALQKQANPMAYVCLLTTSPSPRDSCA
ncbi:aconitate hydratase B, partial [Citrobacter portucalensis]